MKKYTREQISEIVNKCSDEVLERNKDKFIEIVSDINMYKADPEALINFVTLFYFEMQQNCKETIIDTLDKILNG